MYIFLTLLIAAFLAIIPASIARDKGYNFGLWWFYGWMLFIVAIIHVQFIPDKKAHADGKSHSTSVSYYPSSLGTVDEEMKLYKQQLEKGEISEEEYKRRERQINQAI